MILQTEKNPWQKLIEKLSKYKAICWRLSYQTILAKNTCWNYITLHFTITTEKNLNCFADKDPGMPL